MPLPPITPPLLNSANPWCTTLTQLRELYNNPHTGAITTRTSLLTGFPHDPAHHQFTFFNPSTHASSAVNTDPSSDTSATGSLNTLGYSPIPLSSYLDYIQTISDALPTAPPKEREQTGHKPIIISVTGSPPEIAQCYKEIHAHQPLVKMPLAMEVNLSCPNIPGKTPPAYNPAALREYLAALKVEIDVGLVKTAGQVQIPVGIKIPPYTYHEQFTALIDVLVESGEGMGGMKPVYLPCPVSFVTAVNTLGSSLLLGPAGDSAGGASTGAVLKSANGSGIGGLAGAPLHPLALGNVATMRRLLDEREEVKGIVIIGTGGVEDKSGFERMRRVGAAAVGVGTALGRKGVDVFGEIMNG
jgi:dihydroorotate dehydrogenase (fumarate)